MVDYSFFIPFLSGHMEENLPYVGKWKNDVVVKCGRQTSVLLKKQSTPFF
jgi:hypothetical protein